MAVEQLVGPVPIGWEYTTLGEACARGRGDVQTGPFGSQLHAADYVPDGIPSIMPQNIGDNRVVREGIARITLQDAERLARYRVRRGDIVYSRRGDVEKRSLIRTEEEGWLCGTGCLRVRMGNDDIDPVYASYYLGDPRVREWIVRHAHGATMPNLNTQILSDLPFVVPPISDQRAIAHILGTLDDKIELNRKLNETLEAMARALFKSWFVDFDPVRAKAEGRDPGLPKHLADLFPDSFEGSEMGNEIPRGWQAGVLDDLTSVLLGGDWGSEQPTNEECTSALCIRGADIPELQRGGVGNMPTRYLKESSLRKRCLREGDLVIEISGGSPTQSTGRTVLISDSLLRRLDKPLTCSNFCRVLKLKSRIAGRFVYLWLRHLYSQGEFLRFETGTTGIKNFAVTRFTETFQVVLPPVQVMQAFDALTAPMFEKDQSNGAHADTLAAVRDALLPKLISGELRVKDAQQLVEAV